jgi:quinol monooxygenase YgiN
MADGVRVMATMRAKTGRGDELRGLLDALVPKVLAEDGNQEYAAWRDTSDPDLFVFWELWETPEALRNHGKAPHLAEFGATARDLLEGGAKINVLRPA